MVYRFCDKKTRSKVSLNKHSRWTVIEKLKRTRVFARFNDNNWAADSAEMRSLYSKKRSVKYLFCE